MFILKLLGGASLEGPDGPLTGRVSQRRRLAALALLAMSRRQGLSRETLAATLWPESDGDRARHLLSDTVYVINRTLGGEVITAVADELRLQPDRLTCDARAFEDAAARGALVEAARLYTGPFLDGFFVDGNEDFERWSASERERLQHLHGQVLERLALEQEERGDVRGAAEQWRRLAAADPFNSRVACRLAEAQLRYGDRAGAVQQLLAHIATVRQELGIAAPADVTALVRELRSPPAAPPEAEAGPPAVPARDAEPAAPDQFANDAVSHGGPATLSAQASPLLARESFGRLSWRVALGAVAAGVLVAAGIRLLWPGPGAAVTATSLQSVAVLPFADLSPGRDQEYFGDGIAEELSTRLGRVPGLRVAARTSAFAFKGTGSDAQTIGRALDVDALVEGSVRQAEGRVRIAARLIDAHTGYQIWTDSWERSGKDVLALQDEIATSVLHVLRPAATAAAAGRSALPVDPAAYDLYLQGRYFWHQRTRDSLTRSAAAFERAAALAPGYAPAHSGVADAYAVLGFYDHLPPREAFPRAKAAATRALALDDGLAEAHASLGYVALYYDWDWPAAERALDRAIALNPNYSVAHQWRANYLVARGRFDEAVTAMRRAQEIDPLSLIASAALGWVHYHRRDPAAAVQQCRRTIELNPGFEQAWLWGGMAHESAGRHADSVAMLQQAATLSQRRAPVLAALGRALAVSGDSAGARRLVEEIGRDHAGYLPAYEMAKLHLGLGDTAAALDWLGRAYDQHSHSLVFLAVDPQLDALRPDARFRDLLAKAGVSGG